MSKNEPTEDQKIKRAALVRLLRFYEKGFEQDIMDDLFETTDDDDYPVAGFLTGCRIMRESERFFSFPKFLEIVTENSEWKPNVTRRLPPATEEDHQALADL